MIRLEIEFILHVLTLKSMQTLLWLEIIRGYCQLYDLFTVSRKYMSDIMIIVMSVIYINKEDKILICTKTVLLK